MCSKAQVCHVLTLNQTQDLSHTTPLAAWVLCTAALPTALPAKFFLEVMQIIYGVSQWITDRRNHSSVNSEPWKQFAESVLTVQWSLEQQSPKWGAGSPDKCSRSSFRVQEENTSHVDVNNL